MLDSIIYLIFIIVIFFMLFRVYRHNNLHMSSIACIIFIFLIFSYALGFLFIIDMKMSQDHRAPNGAVPVDSNEVYRNAVQDLVPNGAESIPNPNDNDVTKARAVQSLVTEKSVLEKLLLDNENLQERIRTIEMQIQKYEKSLKLTEEVPVLNYRDRKRILVVGGAGFVGSHLVDRLMRTGHEVTVADNFFTGRKINIEHWMGHPNFNLLTHDIVNPLYIEVDQIYHLASPASPPHYMFNPVKTVKTNTLGTINLLGLAKRIRARLLLASTSEVYGDPVQHPQSEDYWGNVNPIGPRACYDEGKRVAETLCYAYAKQEKVDVRVARIFNTYGPRMHMDDGRVVSNIILQVLQNESITVYGKGDQTRSFQYVSDLVDGLIRLMNCNYTLPINLGNPEEITILEFAKFVKDLIPKSTSQIEFMPKMEDDPHRRRPDISRAQRTLEWNPTVSLKRGVLITIQYFAQELRLNGFSYHKETTEGLIDIDGNNVL